MTQKRNVPPSILRPADAAAYMGFSLTTLWRLGNTDPDFPKKIKFSTRVCGYKIADIDNYLTKKTGQSC